MPLTIPSQPTEATSISENPDHFMSWVKGVPVVTSYHGVELNVNQARDISLLIRRTAISRSYSISWVQQEMHHIDGLVQQMVDELTAHKAIIPVVWDMVDDEIQLLQHQWKAPREPPGDLLTKCAVVKAAGEIVQELRRIQDPRLQPAIDVLRIIIDDHGFGAAYQSWIMEEVANPIAFEDPPFSTSVDLTSVDLTGLGEKSILRWFGDISYALQTATEGQEIRAPFDVLFPKIFEMYRIDTFIKTKYAPDCDNPTPDTRIDGFVIYPLGERELYDEASIMADWLKDASEGVTLGQLAVRYRHQNNTYREVEQQLTCDLVTASTVNLVLGVHMPVFGLAIHRDRAGAYICEAKPAGHPRWQLGRNECKCTGMHHAVAEFMDFGDLRELPNFLCFVSFLVAYKKWYFTEVIKYIPSDDNNWIERRALSAFHTYGPWRDEDARDIFILRQKSRPGDGNDNDNDSGDGSAVGSFDGGPNPDDELARGKGSGTDTTDEYTLPLDEWMGPHSVPDEVRYELIELLRDVNRHSRGLARANRRLVECCFGTPNSLPGAHEEHSVLSNGPHK
ncbi:hypothetical protein K435DRAFT_785961 [Dendrothele bispora CBS 962.96]|uniref:Uncharacterized protein n=1 Tax=Dendrothele bispora (strain CBS 962.96) TaxID=1314807 RepID=A0A4S8KTE5_DENBC|nr:hypothetical protein K435DRAFT_785961 [Dendrothele bispora CBS 962.96]